jgi:DNA-binding MarR family transcriptional regulator
MRWSFKLAKSKDSEESREIEEKAISKVVKHWAALLPQLDSTAFSIQIKIYQINLLTVRATNVLAKEFDLNTLDIQLLMTIHREADEKLIRPSDLWRIFDLAPSVITYRVDRLHDLGFVVRLANLADRRTLHLKLTTKGETALKTVVRKFNRITIRKLASVDKARGRLKFDQLLTAYLDAWKDPGDAD